MNSLPATLRPWSRALVFPLLGEGGAGGGTEAGGGGRNCRLLPVLIKWPYGEWTTPTWLSVLPTMLRHQKALLGDHAILKADMWFTTSASFRKTRFQPTSRGALKYLFLWFERTLGIFYLCAQLHCVIFSEYIPAFLKMLSGKLTILQFPISYSSKKAVSLFCTFLERPMFDIVVLFGLMFRKAKK